MFIFFALAAQRHLPSNLCLFVSFHALRPDRLAESGRLRLAGAFNGMSGPHLCWTAMRRPNCLASATWERDGSGMLSFLRLR